MKKYSSKILILIAWLIAIFCGKILFAKGYSFKSEVLYYCTLLLAGFIFIFFGKRKIKINNYILAFSIVCSSVVLIYFLVKK